MTCTRSKALTFFRAGCPVVWLVWFANYGLALAGCPASVAEAPASV